MNQKPLVKTYCGGKPNYVDEPNPLVTPAPKREWVGLTDEERYLGDARSDQEIEYAKTIEAKLKEKNS